MVRYCPEMALNYCYFCTRVVPELLQNYTEKKKKRKKKKKEEKKRRTKSEIWAETALWGTSKSGTGRQWNRSEIVQDHLDGFLGCFWSSMLDSCSHQLENYGARSCRLIRVSMAYLVHRVLYCICRSVDYCNRYLIGIALIHARMACIRYSAS